MDVVPITPARAANLATRGDNYKKEGRGLQLLSRVIQEDGRLEFHKSFEKAHADCCVYTPGALALGIQLKTVGVDWVQTKTGNKYYSFQGTDGYAGLLLVLVATHVQPPRIWLADGAKVVSKCVQIPVESRRTPKSDRVQAVEFSTLARAIYEIYAAALSGSSTYMLRSPMDHEKPADSSTLAEYDAFKRLQGLLPVLFVDPPAEHMSYDYLVDGKKWQLKLARYDDNSNRYNVICHREAGKVGGKRTIMQYAIDDFDFLCIQLPKDAVGCCYVIPQVVLAKHKVIGKAKSGGAVYVYPHRTVQARYCAHTAKAHWTEAYRIDFADNPLAKLACITQRGLAASDIS